MTLLKLMHKLGKQKQINNLMNSPLPMRIGIIGGSTLLDSAIFPKLTRIMVTTSYGAVEALSSDKVCFIQRHQKNLPPHRINHRLDVAAFEQLGIKKVIGVSSVGSLKKSLAPGKIVVIDDYIQLSNIHTFCDQEMIFTVPGFSEELRKLIVQTARKLKIPLVAKGTYFHTTGPRFETKAEIRMMSSFADVVGMTIGNEATLMKEKGIDYACMCTVDNFANGISKSEINWQKIKSCQKQNLVDVKKILDAIVRKVK